jgi:predicted RNase H-like HicB family nuclease
MRFALTEYVERATASATHDKLEDGTFAGRIPKCKGIVAFGRTLSERQDILRSTMEDWILIGLKMGHRLPVIGGIDLNRRPIRARVAAV